MLVKSCFKDSLDLKEIENCHYVYSRDFIRIDMKKLQQLMELSKFIRHQIQEKHANLCKRVKMKKRINKKKN